MKGIKQATADKFRNLILVIMIAPMFVVGISVGVWMLKGELIRTNGTPAYDSENGVLLPAIMYHSILGDKNRAGNFVISPALLEEDMSYLQQNGYESVSIADLVDYVYNGVSLPQKPVLITFDDGYYNNFSDALPILQKYNMKAVVSIVGVFCDSSTQAADKNPKYAHLAWDDVEKIYESGIIEIGNHTYNMHSTETRKGASRLPGEDIQVYQEILREDLSTLQETIQRRCGDNMVPKVFTYPFGAISRESISIIKDMGFLATLTCYEKPNYITRNPDTLYGINRYNRPSGISTWEFMQRALSK